ncbi:MAG: polysaccharide pyruvyl transferase family protein [Candidatus Omnitrophota bacterium]
MKKVISHKRIGIYGFYGFGNIGDEAILSAMILALKNEIKDVKITVFSNDPSGTTKIHKVRAIRQIPFRIIPFGIAFLKGRFFQILNELWNTDLLIIGGGGFLSDWQSWTIIPEWLWPAVAAKIFKKKVMLYAVGVSGVKTKAGKFLIKISLNRFIDVITVRDDISRRWLKKSGVKKEIHITADPAILLEPTESDRTNEILKKEQINDSNPLIGIAVAPIFKNPKYGHNQQKRFGELRDFWIKLIDIIALKFKADIIIIPMQLPLDREYAQNLLQDIKNKHRVKIITGNYVPREIMGLIGRMGILIGMRFHSLVFAAKMGVPMVGIIYDPKAHCFLKEMGQRKFAMDIGDGTLWRNKKLNLDEVVKNLDIVWLNKKGIKEDIEKMTEKLCSKALLNAKLSHVLLEKDGK